MTTARKLPTIDDLDALPPGTKGEIIDGVLSTRPRPRGQHQRTEGGIFADLVGPYDRDRGGPGGWWILIEPGVELSGTPEIAPDLAGWRRERLPSLPHDEPIRVVPDWTCEILSSSTRRHDLLVKKPYYARIGVAHHWIVDLEARIGFAYRLENGRWSELGAFGDETNARIEIFDAVPLDVSRWWA